MTHTSSHVIIDRVASNVDSLCADFWNISPKQVMARIEQIAVDAKALKDEADAEDDD